MPELSWLAGHLDSDLLSRAQDEATHRLVYAAFDTERERQFSDEIQFSSEALQLVLADALSVARTDPGTRELCAQVFGLARTQVPLDDDLSARSYLLRICCIGWLADQAPIAAKLLIDRTFPVEISDNASWSERVTSTVVDTWLLLFRKRNWNDIDSLLRMIVSLREQQSDYERQYLEEQGDSTHPAAWELVSLYHLARACEIIATFLTQGQSDQRFDVRQQVEAHFDRSQTAIAHTNSIELPNLIDILAPVAQQLLDNSLWTVARAAGPAAAEFVQEIVSRGRSKPFFEVLPPQRKALAEDGLARAAQRSVVVSLPTSAGKTLIAQFRILQALSLFESVGGWVAYVAPTRALVNQVTARLRRDFGPLGIQVERVGPALEIDSLEAGVLTDQDPSRRFRVLVSTPEKLDLMLRSGWHDRINRPLCLVVVDEAHNLAELGRGLKLELLLATINRELRDAQFLLLTPFIDNANEIARWLDPTSNQTVQQTIDWQPNDRIIGLSHRRAGAKRGDYHVTLESLSTSRNTLAISEEIEVGSNRPLGFTMSGAKSPNHLAAVTSSLLQGRGSTITLTQTPNYAWSVASTLLDTGATMVSDDPNVAVVRRVVAHEFGDDFPLVKMLERGIGVHHGGLSDEVRMLMEWLLENGHLQHLVSTTTVAQGVNFPVANVVFATHQYPYGQTMPPSDFWNIAGRAGRVDQGKTGLIMLACPDEDRAEVLRQFVESNVIALNSTLVEMVKAVFDSGAELNLRHLSYMPEWSAFLQFLAHTYRQVGNHEEFATEVEQILRGTLGFQSLRSTNSSWARQLVTSVREYAQGLTGKPLSLVDSTGFSWESVSATLARLASSRVDAQTWQEPIYGDDGRSLRNMIGVMLQVPELHDSLVDASKGHADAGRFLADVVRDWVNGMSIRDLAATYFDDRDKLKSITRCCRHLFGKIAPTIAWGMSALQSLTLGDTLGELDDASVNELRNLPACAYYGVQSHDAIALRILGVPRSAASPLATVLGQRATPDNAGESALVDLRGQLRNATVQDWSTALGDSRGADYHRVWQILEGVM